jgi:hypothetical protein
MIADLFMIRSLTSEAFQAEASPVGNPESRYCGKRAANEILPSYPGRKAPAGMAGAFPSTVLKNRKLH